MTLDQAINRALEQAKNEQHKPEYGTSKECKDCAAEYIQLAYWLKDLKEYKTKKSGEWLNHQFDTYLCYFTATCSNCGYSSSDHFVIEGSHRYCERCGAKMKYK